MIVWTVIAFLLVGVHAEEPTGMLVNWEPFAIEEVLDTKTSVDVIKNIPVNYFWDVVKESYRTGLIGERIQGSIPRLVSTLNKKVNIGGKTRMLETQIVDSTQLFMHSMSAIQHVLSLENSIREKLRIFVMNDESVEDKTGGYVNLQVMDNSFESIPELHSRKSYLSTRLEMYRNLLVVHNRSITRMIDRAQARSSRIMNERKLHHDDMLQELCSHNLRLNQTSAARNQDFNNVVIQIESNRKAREMEALEASYASEIAYMDTMINTTLEALLYRAKKESLLLQELQEFDESHVNSAQTQLLQKEVKECIDAVFAELYNIFSFMEDPWRALLLLRYAIAAITLLIVALELQKFSMSLLEVISGKQAFAARIICRGGASATSVTKTAGGHNRWFSIQSASLGDNKNASALGLQLSTTHNLILEFSIRERLGCIVESIYVSVRHLLPLPNVLVLGPAGTGKSALSRVLTDALVLNHPAEPSLSVGHIVICGGDLQAMGDSGATLYITKLLRTATRNLQRKSRFLVVLDEADSIIRSRDTEPTRGPSGGSSSSSLGCLFSLLAGLRENSFNVSLVVTSRLGMGEIDAALLDRMDLTLQLSPPAAQERLQYVAYALRDSLSRFIRESDQKKWLKVQVPCNSPLGHQLMHMVCGAVLEFHHPTESVHYDAVDSTGNGGTSNVESVVDPETELPAISMPAAYVSNYKFRDETASASSNIDNDAIGGRALMDLDIDILERSQQDQQQDSFDIATSIISHMDQFSCDSFCLLTCLKTMLLISAGWSFRDLDQFLSAVTYAVQCSEGTQLTTKTWMQELLYTYEK